MYKAGEQISVKPINCNEGFSEWISLVIEEIEFFIDKEDEMYYKTVEVFSEVSTIAFPVIFNKQSPKVWAIVMIMYSFETQNRTYLDNKKMNAFIQEHQEEITEVTNIFCKLTENAGFEFLNKGSVLNVEG